jgi:hypothetical protein
MGAGEIRPFFMCTVLQKVTVHFSTVGKAKALNLMNFKGCAGSAWYLTERTEMFCLCKREATQPAQPPYSLSYC